MKGLCIEQDRVAIVTINGFLAKAVDRVPENAIVEKAFEAGAMEKFPTTGD